MKLTRTILMSFLVMVLVSAWSFPPAGLNLAGSSVSGDTFITVSAPLAAGGTANLQVTNKTGGVIAEFKLTGTKNYTFYNLPVGKSTFTIEKGKYTLEYKACGANKVKKLSITANKKFNTVACPTAKITIINNTGGNMYMSLTGPANYTFNFPPGKTKITVLKGTYSYYISAPCGTDSGTQKLSGNKYWSWFCY